jgi:hypothetical protein
MVVLVVALGTPLMSTAQEFAPIPSKMRANQLVYTGPGTNAGIVEYAAVGRDVMAQGRNMDTSWIEIVLDGQVEGWVPAGTVRPLEGNLADLPIRGGLLDLGNGAYSASNSNIRQAEAEMLRVQRSLRIIQARFNRLQAFLGTNCDPIPVPSAPTISDSMIAAVPELAQVRTELTFVQEQTALAISVFQVACDENSIGEETYQRLMRHVYAAGSAFNNVRRYLNAISGLEFVMPVD